MNHPTYDDYWKSYGVKEKYGDIKAPAYLVSGWYHNLVHETWRNFEGLRQLGGPLITYDGTQHTAVFNGDQCVDTAVVRYFVLGTLPPASLQCQS